MFASSSISFDVFQACSESFTLRIRIRLPEGLETVEIVCSDIEKEKTRRKKKSILPRRDVRCAQ